MAKYPCPQCGRKMFIEEVHEGYEVPCPHCGDRFRVPPGAAAEAAAAVGSVAGAAVDDFAEGAAPAEAATGADASADPPTDTSADSSEEVRDDLDVEPPSPPDGFSMTPEETPSPAVPASPGRARTSSSSPFDSSPRDLPPVPDPRRTGRSDESDGTLIFVIALVGLSITCCSPLAPVAWFMGHRHRSRARASVVPADRMATAGWIMGMVGSAFLLGYSALYLVMIIVSMAQ